MFWVNQEKKRYYRAMLVPDFFGGCALLLSWGGIDSNRGGGKKQWYPSLDEAHAALARLSKRRCARGYKVCAD